MNQHACILVCVTGQRECERLIRHGKALADEQKLPLHVLHVSPRKSLPGNPDAAALNYLFSLAHEVDGEMNILYENDAPAAIARYARAHHARAIIIGENKSGFADTLHGLLPPETQLICPVDP